MSDYFVYSHEELPRTDLFTSRDYNPGNDWIAYNGIHIGVVPAKTWTKVPDRLRSVRHVDRADKQGHPYHVFADEIAKANAERLKPRGVIFLDHAPTDAEKAELEALAETRNLQFRMDAVQVYEETLKVAESQGHTLKANTYVKECYKLLGMERPNSIEAARAQRQPGEAAAERIATALESVFTRLLAAQKSAPKEAAAK